MAIPDQSTLQERTRTAYGGSDTTSPFFLRPQYVKYNSLGKSRDFGVLDNFGATLSGTIGSQAGASTLFFKVQTVGVARIGIRARPVNRYADRAISVSICDENRDPLPMSEAGFACLNAVHNVGLGLPSDLMPAGVYYFTVSCTQWQETPFEVAAIVQRYLELRGAIGYQLILRGRLPLAKLNGAITGSLPAVGSLKRPNTIDRLGGNAGGTLSPRLTLSIMRGAVIGSMPASGRLKQTFRISGSVSGTSPSVATMTTSRPYGYGY
jgi:hypothetical protein